MRVSCTGIQLALSFVVVVAGASNCVLLSSVAEEAQRGFSPALPTRAPVAPRLSSSKTLRAWEGSPNRRGDARSVLVAPTIGQQAGWAAKSRPVLLPQPKRRIMATQLVCKRKGEPLIGFTWEA